MYLNALLFLSMSNMCMSMYVKLYESAQMSYYVNVYICQSANILPVKQVYLFIHVISSPWNSIFLSDIFARIELFTNSYSVTTYLDYVIDFFMLCTFWDLHSTTACHVKSDFYCKIFFICSFPTVHQLGNIMV